MTEELEDEKSSGGVDIQRYLGLVRRRHIHFLIPLFLGWVLVWSASWVLPPRYQSSTLILVEQPTMPKDYVTPNVNEDLQVRLQSITQQILSRTRLLHIIDQFNLYSAQHAQRTPDEKVEMMRKDIDIDLVKDIRTNQITSFNVAFTSGDPHMAQQVTSELTNLFINENLEVRQQQSEDTTKFLESQLETSRKSLSEQEDRIREFKAEHVGEMPTQLATNLQILSGLQSQLQNEEDALNSSKQQRVYLQSLADQYRTMQGSMKSADGTPVGVAALDQELDRLKAQLADLRAHYTERHPDVRKLKQQIADTEKTREELQASLKAKSASGADDADGSAASPATDRNQNAAVPQVQSQLRSNQVEIANREHSIAALKAKVEDYQGRLNQEPVREQQLADLTRGYEQSKANYDELLKKKNESAMATSMELLQQGERFHIMDAPALPQKPVFPNRLKFCGIGLGVGLALGGIFTGLFEVLDRRLHDEKELKELLPVAILVEIPEVITLADEKTQSRRLWLGWAVAAIVFGTILAGSAFSYLRG
jgi:succinoglycan biosynthesis transport protein ExoP